MHLEYYSIKRFFFLSFGENFVIFLILALFVSFGGIETHFLHLKFIFLSEIHFLKFETRFLKGIGGYLIKIGCGEWI